MVDNCERIELMKARDDATVLNVRQTADMKNQLRTATARG